MTEYIGFLAPYAAFSGSTILTNKFPDTSTETLSLVIALCGKISNARSLTSITYATRSTMGTAKKYPDSWMSCSFPNRSTTMRCPWGTMLRMVFVLDMGQWVSSALEVEDSEEPNPNPPPRGESRE